MHFVVQSGSGVSTMPALSSTLISVAMGALFAPAVAHAADPFETLGASGEYTLVALSETGSGTAGGFLQLGSAAHVYGHVGGRYRVETASGVIVEGDSHHGAGGALHGGTILGSDEALDAAAWLDLYGEAAATVQAVRALDATVISGTPTEQCTTSGAATLSMGSMVLHADRDDEGLSVFEIDGCLFLGAGETLLIEGSPQDRFVIRVTGGMRLERGSAIQLDGLPGSAVLFSLEGGGWAGEPTAQVTAEDGPGGVGASISGVFVSPDMYWQLGDGTLMPDTRILAGGVQANIQDMHTTDPITGSPLDDEDEDEDDCEDEGDSGTDEDDVGCVSDDPCPWWDELILIQEFPSASTPADTTKDTASDPGLDGESEGKGCSATALGATWFWLVGAGLLAARRRRSV